MRGAHLLAVRNPEEPDGEKTEAIIPRWLTDKWHKDSPTDFENLRTAKEVLENPERIFWGVRQPEGTGYCYVGKPDHYFITPRCEAPLPPGMLFAVYLDAEMRLYEVRLELSAEDDVLSPKGWRERYGGLAWGNTS